MKRFLIFTLAVLMTLANAEATRWTLTKATADITMSDGDVLTGTLQSGVAINVTIKAGAKVTFEDAVLVFNPKGSVTKGKAAPAVNCLGDAEITIKGENQIINGGNSYSGIYVPNSKKLTIKGTNADKLYVQGGLYGAGIGAYKDVDAGNIQIEGGTIEAHGGMYGAGIGGSYLANCGTIDIYGGNIKAYGGNRGTGIGSGFDSSKAAYVNITKMAGTSTTVYAQGGFRSPGIGAACLGTCGVISISTGVDVTAVKGDESLCSIGWGYGGKSSNAGTITIGGKTYPDGVGRAYFNYPNIHDIDLSKLTEDYIAQDQDVLHGELANENIMISIENNAKITLRDADIEVKAVDRTPFSALVCLGNAEITIEGENVLWCKTYNRCGISVTENNTLTIRGSGILDVEGGRYGAGIGARYLTKGGNVIINCSGTVIATGGQYAAAIGGGYMTSCGFVQIISGTVIAEAGERATAIGSGYDSSYAGDIRLSGGKIDAKGGYKSPAIGGAWRSTCGQIWIDSRVKIRAEKGKDAPCAIGYGMRSSETGQSSCKGIFLDGDYLGDCLDGNPYIYPESDVIDLSTITANLQITNNKTVTGTLSDPNMYKITIADNAEVTFKDVSINGNFSDVKWAGVTCLGDATIKLEGKNRITACGGDYPAIFVPKNSTLVITGNGSLDVHANNAAAIGAGWDIDAGNIFLYGGNITALSNNAGAGIGGAKMADCGDIIVKGANVKAEGGKYGAGIGTGHDGSRCGNIYLTSGSVVAIGGEQAAGVGTGALGKCGNVYLSTEMTGLKAYKGDKSPFSVGHGKGATGCTIYKNGEFYSAGIDRSPFVFPNDHYINLWDIEGDFTAQNNDILTSSGDFANIFVADNATITLQDAKIVGVNEKGYSFAGITCLGNARIILKGKNKVTGYYGDYPAIYVPKGKTLTIAGDGELEAVSLGNAAAIGAAVLKDCGTIKIEGGHILAYTDGDDDAYGAAIGGAYEGAYDKIIITGGEVVAFGANRSAGIGAAYRSTTCGNIEISGGKVYAHGGTLAPGIGAGLRNTTGDITILKTVKYLSVTSGGFANGLTAPYCIGRAAFEGVTTSIIGKVTIADQVVDGISGSRFVYPEGATDEEPENPASEEVVSGEVTPEEDVTGTIMRRVAGNVKLDTITHDFVFINGDMVYGTLQGNYMLSIAPDAQVTLNSVKIEGTNDSKYAFAGLTCMGNAQIVLNGDNTVKGFDKYFPGIFVPENFTLTIKKNSADGTLHASSNGSGCGIGGSTQMSCGNIDIQSGNIYAEGGSYCAAIGCGGGESTCGSINVAETATYIHAVKGAYATYTIGSAVQKTAHGRIVIGTTTYSDGVSESPFIYPSPKTGNKLVLDNIQSDYEITTGTIVTGTLKKNVKLTVRGGAKITLKDVTINGVNSSSYPWAGLTCGEQVEITVEGENTIRGFHENYPGIFIADAGSFNSYIYGPGSLVVSSNGKAPGIGASRSENGGRVFIKGCDIIAYGGQGSAGIGGCYNMSFGGVGFNACSIEAYGGAGAPGIGSGSESTSVVNAGVSIDRNVISIKAVKGSGDVLNSIGNANNRNAKITIGALILKGITDDTFVYDPTQVTSLELMGGETLSGDLSDFHLTLLRGASVKLDGVTINGKNDEKYPYAGLTCMGNNTLELIGLNRDVITGFHEEYPGIEVVDGNLYIMDAEDNWGGLEVKSNGKAPAIGTRSGSHTTGRIVIDCGNSENTRAVTVVGGDLCPAIGAGPNSTIGNIYIKSGIVDATGGSFAAAIGTSAMGGECGEIILSDQANTRCYAGAYSNHSVGTCAYDFSIRGEESTIAGIFKGIRLGNEFAELDREPIRATEFFYPQGDRIPKRRILNGETLSGEVPYRITVAPDATIYLEDAKIGQGGDDRSLYIDPGIFFEGNAIVYFRGVNDIESFNSFLPGIYVPEGRRVILRGYSDEDQLNATCQGEVIRESQIRKVNGRYESKSADYTPKQAAGIGGAYTWDPVTLVKKLNCGEIVIESGHVTAVGGLNHPGIGGGEAGDCGKITILGGIVEAVGGPGCPGIGAGCGGSCDEINIAKTVKRVHSTAGMDAPFSVGAAMSSDTENLHSMCNGVTVGTKEYGNGIVDPDFLYEPWDGNLSILDKDVIAKDGTEIYGTLESSVQPYKVTIADGATVVLRDAHINTEDTWENKWAGITCEGNATIVLEGENSVQGFQLYMPGIYVPEGKTLTITGDEGYLYAESGGWAAGIGAGFDGRHCGNIMIEGGSIEAKGGMLSAGIGGAAGANCGDITICRDVKSVIAYKGTEDPNTHELAPYSLGAGGRTSACGTITIADKEYQSFIDDVFEYPFEPVQGIPSIDSEKTNSEWHKVLYNGQLLIIRDGKAYNLLGTEVQ